MIGDMDERNPVLTVAEVAEVLRVDSSVVLRLLDGGELPGFKVAGESRVLATVLTEYMLNATAKSTQRARLQSVVREFHDPRSWRIEARRLLRTDPEEAARVREQRFPEQSMGALLQEALREAEQERDEIAELEAALDTGDTAEPESDRDPE
jgi:excisionase family DNA binding protein